jgi:altronate hydrolase
MLKRMLIINPVDNVGVVLEDVSAGDEAAAPGVRVAARENIEFAHKIALRDLDAGEEIIKYGNSIGYAMKDIKQGEWIHIHNMDCERARTGRLV